MAGGPYACLLYTSIAEEGELKLLRQDVLDELLEACYINAETSFLEFVEKFGTGRNDKKIEEIILKLYDYSRSYPQPELWLDACVRSYRTGRDDGTGTEPACMERVKVLVRQKTGDMLRCV